MVKTTFAEIRFSLVGTNPQRWLAVACKRPNDIQLSANFLQRGLVALVLLGLIQVPVSLLPAHGATPIYPSRTSATTADGDQEVKQIVSDALKTMADTQSELGKAREELDQLREKVRELEAEKTIQSVMDNQGSANSGNVPVSAGPSDKVLFQMQPLNLPSIIPAPSNGTVAEVMPGDMKPAMAENAETRNNVVSTSNADGTSTLQAPAEPSESVLPQLHPLPPYTLGPGDVLNVYLLGTDLVLEHSENRSQEVVESTVMPDGTVQIPPLGQIPVAGMTLKELEAYVNVEIKKYYRYAIANLALSKAKDLKVVVMGAVERQGSYVMDPTATVSQVLEKAGGAKLIADLRHVVVKAADGKVKTFDLWGATVQDELNFHLDYGDMIFVPESKKTLDWKEIASHNLTNRPFKVRVIGQVMKPGEHIVDAGTDVISSIAVAGGFTPTAKKGKATVIRSDLLTGKLTRFTVSLGGLGKGKQGDAVELYPDDVVIVDSSTAKFIGKQMMDLPRFAGIASFNAAAAKFFLNTD